MSEAKIKAGLRFKDGNVSFEVLHPTLHKKGFWDVKQNVPGGHGFMRSTPKIVSLSEEKILELESRYIGDVGARQMNTVGTSTCVGARPKYRQGNGRTLRRVKVNTTAKVSA
ncbi:MAG: hypothetical protein WCG07_01155 [Candidatus Taylorbacteria bacterium]